MTQLQTFAFLIIIFFLSLISQLAYSKPPIGTNQVLHPVILIPGLTGSQLEAKLDKPRTVNWLCRKTSDWFSFWVNLSLLLPFKIDCYLDNLIMKYNRTSRRTYNNDGVQIRPFKFGDTTGLEYFVAGVKRPEDGYLYKMVETFVNLSYTRNLNIRGAPYDFRRAPNDNEQFMVDFKALVEETYVLNGNVPVYLVPHSMGCTYALYFLNQQDANWKAKYIKGMIALGGHWAGVTVMISNLAGGNNFDLPIYPNKMFRGMERSMSSVYFVLPSKAAFEGQTLMMYNGQNFTTDDYDEYFELLNIPDGKMMYEDSKNLTIELKHPGVDVYCAYSRGFQSPQTVVYPTKESFPDNPTFIFGPGDGTVNQGSLAACQRWANQTEFKFTLKIFDGVKHVDMAKDSRVLQYIADIVTGNLAEAN